VQCARGAWRHFRQSQVTLGRSRVCPNMKGRLMSAPWPPQSRSICTPLGSDEFCVLDAQKARRQAGVWHTKTHYGPWFPYGSITWSPFIRRVAHLVPGAQRPGVSWHCDPRAAVRFFPSKDCAIYLPSLFQTISSVSTPYHSLLFLSFSCALIFPSALSGASVVSSCTFLYSSFLACQCPQYLVRNPALSLSPVTPLLAP